jgi:hypothetical protein
MSNERGAATPCESHTARYLVTSATKSVITTGTAWCAMAACSTIRHSRKHYANGAPPNWQEQFISSYATTHPWEDFAETWAHYLHIVDTLEMAGAFNLRASPQLDTDIAANVDFNPYAAVDVQQLTNSWIPLTFALNSLNRTMGREDLYPFIISPPVIEKLGFVHSVIHKAEPCSQS